MSLSPQQIQHTKEEFQANFKRSGLSLEQIATDLETTPAVIAATLNLDVSRLEDPWVLKNYLEAALAQQGSASIPFTALTGDYHRYWFLNSCRIDQRKIG